MKKRIQACCFDLGNTLNNDILLTEKSVNEMGEWMQSNKYCPSGRDFTEIYHRINHAASGPFYSHTYGEADFFLQTFQALSITGISPEDALVKYRSIVDRNTPIDAVLRSALDYLTTLGIRKAIMSNERTARVNAYLERTGLRSCFDTIVVSEDCGYEKPEPGFFKAALDRLHIPPEQAGTVALFGDNTIADGACKDHGMLFVLVTSFYSRRWYFERGSEHTPDYTIDTISPDTLRVFLNSFAD